MINQQSNKWINKGVFYLASGLTYEAVFLRSIIIYQSTPYLREIVELLGSFLLLFLIVNLLSRDIGRWIHVYLGVQTILVCLLLFNPQHEHYDYFSILFGVLGMQAMQNLSFRKGVGWVGFFFILIAFRFVSAQGVLKGLINVLLFGSVIFFLCAYALTTRQARKANDNNQIIMKQLQEANIQLQSHSNTLKQLGIANERQRLARELHDSVTQTIFSMTLTTQSALLLLDRDPSRLSVQLERLNQLTQSALTEMHTLISELRPETPSGGLVAELKKYVKNREIDEGLSVSFEIDGDQKLSMKEEQGLLRIAQEAINNVVKHSRGSKGWVRFHLIEPYWIEIEDNGHGFNLEQAQKSGHLGLASMGERAGEINWNLSIRTAPYKGTLIRAEKKHPAETRS